jgi:hypothetical protein
LRYIFLCIPAIFLLSACLPEPQKVHHQEREQTESLIKQYARSAVQYSAITQSAITRSDDWVEWSLGNGTLSSLGISLPGNMNVDYLDSGFCKEDTDPLNVTEYIFTWFILNDGTNISINSLGANQAGRLSKELGLLLPGGNFGIHKSGVLYLAGVDSTTATATLTLPANCLVLPIPNGAPVIYYETGHREAPVDYQTSEEWFEVETNLDVSRNYLQEESETGADLLDVDETYDFIPFFP